MGNLKQISATEVKNMKQIIVKHETADIRSDFEKLICHIKKCGPYSVED